MTKIWCCRRFQEAEVFKISPTRKNILQEFVLFTKACSCCKSPVLEIIRADINEKMLKPVRLSPKKVSGFVEKMDVLWKPRKTFCPKNKISKFVLNYNEFGKVRKCSSNLSALMIGRIETDPVGNLKTYKKHRDSLLRSGSESLKSRLFPKTKQLTLFNTLKFAHKQG